MYLELLDPRTELCFSISFRFFFLLLFSNTHTHKKKHIIKDLRKTLQQVHEKIGGARDESLITVETM